MKIQKGNIGDEMLKKRTSFQASLLADTSEEDIKIEMLIREKYSNSMEIALHRKKLMGVADETEWTSYCAYVQECIDKVREETPDE